METIKDKVIDYGGNGLQFEENGENRPRVQDLENGEFVISGLVDGNAYLNKEDIDDLIILLKKLKHTISK